MSGAVASPQRVVVTGATGFLGGALARALCRRGAEVHALCRPDSDRGPLQDLPIAWHPGDVVAPESFKGLFARADLVVHAAGRLGQAGVPEQRYRELNVQGTANVLAAALASAPGARVLHLSSPGVIGATSREPADERTPHRPANPYERSKAAAERVAVDFAARGLTVIIARPGFVYGPGDHHVLGLFRAIQRRRFFLVDGGRALCQPTHVDDAVAGMLSCLDAGRPGEAYHLVGPRAVTFRELGEALAGALGVAPSRLSLPRWSAMAAATGLELLGRLAGKTPPLSRAGVSFFADDRVFSWRKAHQELGYAPTRDLADGLAETVAWYRRRGWL
ncbi:MAG TPA: NAD-dependent epimerase/dehydratase family protein [Anaeromyxobacteraceae bacterium]|jgi:nucleoside-diphosphate-sugar epimerase|nr:NAD-dependent epimerase/dehydratase family protein [Anaeromyxobacteraceae bacterium]